MDVVGGRTSGISQGSVLVDGKPLNSEILRTTSTFTPQNEDGLPSVLTVREILTYAGMLRSQSRLSHRSCAATLAKVEEVAACLGLSEKMDRAVGTSTSFGLSSGEKKRLSIGMDVLAERKIMVVDEPTTGLDSISAMAVTNALSQLSRLVTVVCPIQQPPWPLLCKFDKIAFLNAGRVVYCGPPSSFQQYISDCGWAPCPVDENPAEHFMLVLTTSTDTAEWHEKWESCRRGEELAQTAKNEYLSFSTSGNFDFAEAPRLDNDYLLTGVMPTMAVAKALSSIRTSYSAKTTASSVSYRLSLCEQYLVLTHRCWTVSLKDGSIARLLISSAQMGLLIGLLFYNFAPQTIYAGLCVFCGIASQALIVLNGGVCFVDASERLSIIRDFRGGAHAAWVYWLARATVTTVAVAIVSIVQVPVWWYLFGLNLHPWCVSDMICNSFLLATAFGHVACLIGIVEPNHLRACQLTFPIVAISFLTSGSLILRSQTEVEFRPVYWINPLSSAFQNAMNAAFRNDNSAQLLRYYEIKPGTELRNYAILISWIVLLLAFGCFVMSHAIERQSRRLSTVA